MGKVKDFLIGQIEALSAESGYDFDFLMELFFAYCDECAEAGDALDWGHFRRVSLERDW